jgi:hypothetical protein
MPITKLALMKESETKEQGNLYIRIVITQLGAKIWHRWRSSLRARNLAFPIIG